MRTLLLPEVNPEIWDLRSPLHSNLSAVSAAWDEIAAYRSLRDAKRYRNRQKKQKSDSAAALSLSEDLPMEEWEYEECLQFLITSESMRMTISYGGSGGNAQSPLRSSGSEDENRSNYSYANQRRKKMPRIDEEVLEVSRNIRDMMETYSNNTTPREPQLPEMKNKIMLLNLDRMLQQLPQERVDELNVRWTVDVYNPVLEEREKQKEKQQEK